MRTAPVLAFTVLLLAIPSVFFSQVSIGSGSEDCSNALNPDAAWFQGLNAAPATGKTIIRPLAPVSPVNFASHGAGVSVVKNALATNNAAGSDAVCRKDASTEFQQFVAATTGQLLSVVGASLFPRVPSIVSPNDRTPVASDDVIGRDDKLRIRLGARVSHSGNLIVDRPGKICLPRVGEVQVAGLRFSQLEQHLRAAISHVDRNFDLAADAGRVRSVHVDITGQARCPGIDELRASEMLANRLEMARRTTGIASGASAAVESPDQQYSRQTMEPSLDAEILATSLKDGDLLRINSILPAYRNTVTLRGNSVNPGRHSFRQGWRPSDLIPDKESPVSRGDGWKRRHPGLPAPEFEAEISTTRLDQVWSQNQTTALSLRPQRITTGTGRANAGQSASNAPLAGQVLHQDPGREQDLQTGDAVKSLKAARSAMPELADDMRRTRIAWRNILKVPNDGRSIEILHVIGGEAADSLVGSFAPGSENVAGAACNHDSFFYGAANSVRDFMGMTGTPNGRTKSHLPDFGMQNSGMGCHVVPPQTIAQFRETKPLISTPGAHELIEASLLAANQHAEVAVAMKFRHGSGTGTVKRKILRESGNRES